MLQVRDLPRAQFVVLAGCPCSMGLAVTSMAPEATLLAAVLAASPGGAAVAARDLKLLEVNQALCDLLGYAREDLLGTSLWDLWDPYDAASQENGREHESREVRDRFDRELRLRHRHGRVISTRVTGALLPAQASGTQALLLYVQETGEPQSAREERLATQFHTRQVLERITDGYFALDREWRITYFDEAAARLLEEPRSELLGTNLWETFPEAAESPLFAACHAAARDGVPVSVQNYYPPARAWFDVHIYPSASGLSVFFTDITEARQREQELRTSEAKHRFLLDHVPAVIYALAADRAQTRLYFSPLHEELTGYTLAETLSNSSHWLDLVHPEDHPRVTAENARSEAAGDRFRAEYRLRRKDGSYVWVHDECVPVRDENGHIVTWQGVVLDITDRVSAQAAQGHLAALVMSAEDAVISVDLDGLITSWNPGATRLYGYQAEEMVGCPYGSLLPGESDHEILAARIQAARSGVTLDLFETQRQRQDGTTVDVAIIMSPIRDDNGKVIGVSTIARDITERNRVEQALRDALEAAETAARTKTLFLAMMSHELRTPVQAVLGYADLLLLDPGLSLTPDQRADVTYIRDGARRLDRLIDQLLDLSRLEGGRLVLDVGPVVLGQIIEEVRQDIAPKVMAKHLTLEIDVPPSLPPALGDPDRLRQIVLNLAENAVKFTDMGTVSIRGRAEHNRLVLEVNDTGIGITPEALPTIFEEFRQVDSNLSRRYGGAGLGLAIAERLATQMHGSLSVASEVGRGSTFVLQIPRAPT